MDVALWPWNRHRHACVGCAFLGREINFPIDAGGRAIYQLSPAERDKDEAWDTTCYVGAYDIGAEVLRAVQCSLEKLPEWESLQTAEHQVDRDSLRREAKVKSVREVNNLRRRCEFHTPNRPGLSFEAQLSLRERGDQHRWTLIEAFVGGISGSLLTLLVTAVTLALT